MVSSHRNGLLVSRNGSCASRNGSAGVGIGFHGSRNGMVLEVVRMFYCRNG